MYTDAGLDVSEKIFFELNHAIVNIYKTCMEETGDDLGETNNHVEYHNYLINNPIKICIGGGGFVGDFDLSTLTPTVFGIDGIKPKPKDIIERGIYIAKRLMELMDINAMQACAIIGYMMKESGCDPKACNAPESQGKGTAYANGANCGEGIAQWTNVKFKDQELKVIGVTPHGHPGTITSLSLDQQIEMYAKGSLGKECLKYNLRSCTNFDNAICVACIQGHGSGHAQIAYNKANKDVNSPEYIQACIAEYDSGDLNLARARVWGEQTLRAMAGNSSIISGPGGKFVGGSSGIFSGKSGKEKLAMCGDPEAHSWNWSEAKSLGFIVSVPVPCPPNTIEFNKFAAADLVSILNEIKSLGWFNLSISSAYRAKKSAGGRSRHQWGLAVDINAGSGGNPWFEKRFEDKPIQGELLEGSTAPWKFHIGDNGKIVSAYHGTYSRSKCIWHQGHPVVQIFKKHGWGWGGKYGDVMHFSIDGG